MNVVDYQASYKNELLKKFLTDEDLCKAIYYNVEDFKSQPVLTNTQKNALIYTQVFPFLYQRLQGVDTDSKMLVSYDFLIDVDPNSRTIADILLVVKVHTIKNIQRTPYGCTRSDFVSSRIADIVHNLNVGAISNLELASIKPDIIVNELVGSVLEFTSIDFIGGHYV